MGAVVLHGNAPGWSHFVGPAPGSVTGRHSFATGGERCLRRGVRQDARGLPAISGIPARGSDDDRRRHVRGRDTGLAPSDTGRVWSLTVDRRASPARRRVRRVGGQRLPTRITRRCAAAARSTRPATRPELAAQQHRAAPRPGSTTSRSTASATPRPRCARTAPLFAATSAGLYRSTDAAATWKLDGFEGKVVRAVTVDPQPAASSPRVLVGVEDAVGIYQSR
jgi:hypothetical protein